MTNKGERLRDPEINNICRSASSWLSGFIPACGENPENLKDCGKQAEYSVNEIKKNVFDDKWLCARDAGQGHAWGFCVTLTNHTDPIIWFDHRSNQISENTQCKSCKPWLFFKPQVYGENEIQNKRGSLK